MTVLRTDGSFLETMVAARRKEMSDLDADVLDRALDGFARETTDFCAALTATEEVSVIAEVKKASPSAGPIAPDADVAAQTAAYERGGAAAVSVLVEPTYFGGTFEDIAIARDATCLPILCKDFVVHHDQLLLARARGADAVLLMVSVLGEKTPAYAAAAQDCGLDALVEVHGEEEYAIAAASGARMIAVNARDLRNLSVDTEGSFALIEIAAADGFCVVAASGIRGREDVLAATRVGACAVLVGETLMRASDAEGAVRKLTGVRVREGALS